MNPITGAFKITIDGKAYTVRFDWECLAEIEKKYGENPDYFAPEIVSGIAAIGMQKKHPEMTADKIMEMSPPLIPFGRDIHDAIKYAYFGGEEIPKADGEKKNQKRDGLLPLIKKLFRKE